VPTLVARLEQDADIVFPPVPLLQPVPETAPPVVHLYCCDHLGTPLALINQQGQHYDEESGLYYNRHRYYDPTLGSVCS